MWQNRRWKPPAIPALAVSLVAVLSLGAPRAVAEPRVTGEVVFEVQNDWTYDSEDPNNELNDLFTTTEPDINVYATDWLYLNAHLTLEPVLDPEPRDDRFFEDHGLFVEALSLNLERGRFHVFGGKFGPNFSIAFDAAPGIYGTDISEDDIEISEKLGVGGDVLFGSERVGIHALSASVFFADTTALSESAFENRGRVNVRDGGPSNTETPESFVLALDGEEIPRAPGFRYHVAMARQAVDRVLDGDGNPVGDIADEYRVAVAGEWPVEVSEDITLTPLAEYVRFWNAGGLGNQDRDYVTVSTLVEYRNWNLALAYTGRFIHNHRAEDINDTQFQVSAGYTFDFGLEADIGWRFRDEDRIESQIFGTFLTYTLEF